MKKLLIAVMLLAAAANISFAQGEVKKDPNQLFYTANNLYEKREYDKAIEQYMKALDLGVESGNIYYNIGNSFFKLGKLGQAILYYERAKRLAPQDRDLRSNLTYAKSLIEENAPETTLKNALARFIKRPFRNFSLNNIAICGAALYTVFIFVSVLFILNRLVAKKFAALYIILLAALLINTVAFSVRYYDEQILKHGITIQKNVECKYEPIDKSTNYYTLQEGSNIIILKDRNGWCQVKRPDGKIGWVKRDAVEEI